MIKINNLYLTLRKNVFNENIRLNDNTLLKFVEDFNKVSLDDTYINKYIMVDNILWLFSRCSSKKILKEIFLILYKFKLAYNDLYLAYDDAFGSAIMASKLFTDLSELIIIYSYSHNIELYKSCCNKFINNYIWSLDMNIKNVNFEEIKSYIDILISLDKEYFKVSIEHLNNYYLNHEINNNNVNVNIVN